MSRFTVVLLAAFLLIASLTGCGANQESQQEDEQGASPEPTEEPTASQETTQEQTEETSAAVPAYEVTLDDAGQQMGMSLRNVSASTDATSSEELEAITRELWDTGPTVDAMIVTFYPDTPTADPVGTGEAYRNEEAARTIISAMYADPSEADVESQVEEVMANDGLRVISYEELETTG